MCCFTVFYAKEGGKLGFEDAIDKLELLQPQFVMSVGDYYTLFGFRAIITLFHNSHLVFQERI